MIFAVFLCLGFQEIVKIRNVSLRRIRGERTGMFFDQITIPGKIDIIDLRLALCPFRMCLYPNPFIPPEKLI